MNLPDVLRCDRCKKSDVFMKDNVSLVQLCLLCWANGYQYEPLTTEGHESKRKFIDSIFSREDEDEPFT